MSDATIIARAIGFGPFLDKIEKAEAKPSAANIGDLIATAAPEAVAVATLPTASLLGMVGNVAAGALEFEAAKHGLGDFAVHLIPELFGGIETLIADVVGRHVSEKGPGISAATENDLSPQTGAAQGAPAPFQPHA